MKFNKRKVLVASLAISLIAILSLGSLAWFSDSDEVTNKFHVAGGDDADKIFSIDVMEKVDVDDDDDYDENDATIGTPADDSTWDYKDITPNDVLLKRASALNAGSYDQWIRMKVTVSGEFVDMMNQYGIYFTDILWDIDSCTYSPATKYLEKAREPFNTDGRWEHKANDVDLIVNADGTYTYVFYYKNVVKPDESVVLFSLVHIPYQFTQDDVVRWDADTFNMVIRGEAVQADNTAENARDAFKLVEQTQEIRE